MRFKNFIADTVVAIIATWRLAACAASPPSGFHYDDNHKLIENMPTASTDQFTPSIKVDGLRGFDNPLGGISKQWYIRSFIDKKTGEIADQLYVVLGYSAAHWAFYDGAADDRAKVLPLTTIDRTVVGCFGADICNFSETIGVAIPDDMIRKHTSDGFKVKIIAHDTSWVILTVSQEMTSKQITVVDAQRTALSSHQ